MREKVWLLIALSLAAVLIVLTSSAHGAVRDTWSVSQNGQTLEIGYGSGDDFPQCAVLDLDSSYFRMNPDCSSDWGTSVCLLPAIWESGDAWVEVTAPDGVEELAVLGDTLLARSDDLLFKSEDWGATWHPVTIDLATGVLHALSVDMGIVYVASNRGVVISEDLESFEWSFYWTWDDSRDVDVQDGCGWLAVDMWGSRSGPNRKLPENAYWELRRGVGIPWSAMSMSWVAVDRLDPCNVAYIGGIGKFRTLDGGENWLPLANRVIYSTVLDGTSVAFGTHEFTDDRGETWQSTGISANALVKDPADDLLYAASTDGGIYAGLPGDWTPFGLADRSIRSLAVAGTRLFAASSEGEIFRFDTGAVPIYHQGAPVTATWEVSDADLLISISGTISSLYVEEVLRLSPPGQNRLSATVSAVVDGDVMLADRPGEAFKPVLLSSMHISESVWDAQSAYVDDQFYSISEIGWAVPPEPPVFGQTFGLVGGTSAWKENAPTIEVGLGQPMQIAGWTTASSDPNDDNVAFWAASDEILPSWTYAILATPYRPSRRVHLPLVIRVR